MKIGVFGLVLVCFFAVTITGTPNGQRCSRDSKVKWTKNINFLSSFIKCQKMTINCFVVKKINTLNYDLIKHLWKCLFANEK
jgi:hypothetical protein